MHASLYVAVHKSEVSDGYDAERYVEEMLSTNGFCYNDSDEGSDGGYSDWFEIGGRWSSDLVLQELKMNHGKEKAEQWHTYAHGHFPVTKTRGQEKMIKKIFGRKVKITPEAYKRTHHILAYNKLVKYMIKEGLLSSSNDYYNGGCLYETCSQKKLLDSPDGTYWLVVVDFHS